MRPLILMLVYLSGVYSANILIAYETARRSHQIWIGELAEALAKKGHNITLGGSFAKAIEESEFYHPITFEGIFRTHLQTNRSEHLTSSPLRKLYLNYEYNYAICNKTYHSKGFNSLWNYPDNFKFDLILIDLTFGPCLYPLIQKFGFPPTIGFTPSALTPYLSEMFGNAGYSSDFVSPLLKQPLDTSFLGRTESFIFTQLEIMFKKTWESKALKRLAERMLNDTFDFEDIKRKISLLFVNEFPFLNEAKPLTPNIIPVGGMHIKKVEELPGILSLIIGNANQGIVFFTTGTDISQNIFDKNVKMNFAHAFLRLQQKTVVWRDRLEGDEHPFNDRPSNIVIHKWLPQNDLLGHLHTKLLITTGGTMTIQEALYHGVPVIGIPIYDEHHRNIKFITDNKLGLELDYHNLTEDAIYEAAYTLLTNPVYLHNMEEFAIKIRDQPYDQLKKAVYWVEYVMRHNSSNGADFLIPKSRDTCHLVAYNVDVYIFVFVFIVIFIVFCLFVILKFLKLFLKNLRGKRKDQLKKRKQL
ncbi:UDP-glycosyltransferase UGT5 [Anthonomus grandis grandis]|uniref:UDP-glycosyltransferase UGT5 n=1 Tax=Anthonomus grandis grandis TaxID=2921223 RepID=UPI002164FD10|nr:UDP-glycosyltransferase UGT5 [Anthonomus grandis grandis]